MNATGSRPVCDNRGVGLILAVMADDGYLFTPADVTVTVTP